MERAWQPIRPPGRAHRRARIPLPQRARSLLRTGAALRLRLRQRDPRPCRFPPPAFQAPALASGHPAGRGLRAGPRAGPGRGERPGPVQRQHRQRPDVAGKHATSATSTRRRLPSTGNGSTGQAAGRHAPAAPGQRHAQHQPPGRQPEPRGAFYRKTPYQPTRVRALRAAPRPRDAAPGPHPGGRRRPRPSSRARPSPASATSPTERAAARRARPRLRHGAGAPLRRQPGHRRPSYVSQDPLPAIPGDYIVRPGDELRLSIWGSVDADLRLTVEPGRPHLGAARRLDPRGRPAQRRTGRRSPAASAARLQELPAAGQSSARCARSASSSAATTAAPAA